MGRNLSKGMEWRAMVLDGSYVAGAIRYSSVNKKVYS